MKVVDFARPPCEVNLASLALDRIGKGRVEEIVDPALVGHGEEWVMESVRHVSELAFRCLAFDKDVRPCMSEVAEELRRIRDAAPESGITGPVANMADPQRYFGHPALPASPMWIGFDLENTKTPAGSSYWGLLETPYGDALSNHHSLKADPN
jgi:hypothetical protein